MSISTHTRENLPDMGKVFIYLFFRCIYIWVYAIEYIMLINGYRCSLTYKK